MQFSHLLKDRNYSTCFIALSSFGFCHDGACFKCVFHCLFKKSPLFRSWWVHQLAGSGGQLTFLLGIPEYHFVPIFSGSSFFRKGSFGPSWKSEVGIYNCTDSVVEQSRVRKKTVQIVSFSICGACFTPTLICPGCFPPSLSYLGSVSLSPFPSPSLPPGFF